MRLRLSDVASTVGVSPATVSRVINGRGGVSESTRQSVLSALDELGYKRPSRQADRTSRLIGVIVPELDNPVFAIFAQSLESLLVQRGFTPMLCTQSPLTVGEDEWLQRLLERGADGVIIISGLNADTHSDPQRYQRLRALHMPLVLVNGYVEGVEAGFISDDDETAMELAVTHLASLGHTRIGLAVGPQRYVPVIRKVRGFTRALGQLGASAHALVEYSIFGVEGGHMAAARLLDRGATAIVCASDMMALGAIRCAESRQLSVPDDVSIVGYDDSPLIAFTRPPLTTIRQSVLAMSTAAVRVLLEELHGSPPPRDEFLFRPELVVRGSTGPVPA